MFLEEMRYIKIKIGQLKVENSELLEKLTDNSFSITCQLPLPDIYQKSITN